MLARRNLWVHLPECLYFLSIMPVYNPQKERQKYHETFYKSSSLVPGLYIPHPCARRFSAACRTALNRRTKIYMNFGNKNKKVKGNLCLAISIFYAGIPVVRPRQFFLNAAACHSLQGSIFVTRSYLPSSRRPSLPDIPDFLSYHQYIQQRYRQEQYDAGEEARQ